VGKKWKKSKKGKEKKCTVDYCCNPQWFWVWGNSDFPAPFRVLLIFFLKKKVIQMTYYQKNRLIKKKN